MTITKVQFISPRIEETFLSDYRELLAHFNVNAFKESLSSFMQLNYTAERLMAAPLEPGSYRRILAFSTITLLNRGAVTPLIDFNSAANADMDRLRRETDIDVELIQAPAPQAPTAEELLAAEVRSDWKKLSSDQLRKKKASSRAYSNMLERLANDGTLESSVTSLRIAGS